MPPQKRDHDQCREWNDLAGELPQLTIGRGRIQFNK
jgi:hypothetical protein